MTNTQRKVGLAAKEAGTVKLFFPSEFGVVTYGLGGKGRGWISEKDEINGKFIEKKCFKESSYPIFIDFFKSIDLPYARVFVSTREHSSRFFVLDYLNVISPPRREFGPAGFLG